LQEYDFHALAKTEPHLCFGLGDYTVVGDWGLYLVEEASGGAVYT
jgi:hypothetical protein